MLDPRRDPGPYDTDAPLWRYDQRRNVAANLTYLHFSSVGVVRGISQLHIAIYEHPVVIWHQNLVGTMAVNRIEGDEELHVGGIWALKRPSALAERGITHVLSVVRCSPSEEWGHRYRHMVIDVDDVDDEDLLSELPRAVRFIEAALHPETARGDAAKKDQATGEDDEDRRGMTSDAERSDMRSRLSDSPDAIVPAPALEGLALADPASPSAPGAVFVHCAMGKSRSVAVTAAYLLYKHPAKFGRASHENAAAAASRAAPTPAAKAAVEAAVAHIRRAREIAEPNDGFMSQLELWWDMGCPAAPGRLEANPAYQRWCYRREVERSLAVGEAPSRIRFEDEERGGEAVSATSAAAARREEGRELRCKKCRRVLATAGFVVDHQPDARGAHERYPGQQRQQQRQQEQQQQQQQQCQHFFVEALGWMRGALETGELEGRLTCPNERCGASLGRYSWKGFKCNCGGWVIPAFSLARGRVDEVKTGVGRGRGGVDAKSAAAARVAMGIRMPPSVAPRGSNGGNGRL
ncbi:phosphatases II [Sodiomyces alkalinus F11]|uniref:protein-tyrosine-phosphatase n=1 Tax=Sodiomyces alkalinus (strain CBS 110278 / VKM F-3762 / F11) TaxID=1314773 RepID=A0A3N2PUV3_SODAK|nr:phosphatases II [Sodiomyces alkalinus F11]ROT38270.1 phosphatases II [Sodiomyces alkalinus F11]